MKLPQGYNTTLSERGGTRSGEQRQRIAIARAAIRQAPVVILDKKLNRYLTDRYAKMLPQRKLQLAYF